MLISHRFKFVFLAYPRTASSSIRQILDPFADVKGVRRQIPSAEFPFYIHTNAREALEEFQRLEWEWHSYNRFCVVRNPFTRLPSLFSRRIESERLNKPDSRWSVSAFSRILAKIPTRFSFLVYILSRNPRRGVAQDLPAFTEDLQGNSLVSKVIRYEDLKQELPAYLASIGIQISDDQIPRLNRAKRSMDYRAFYLPITEALIRKKYTSTITKFGYEVIT